MATLYAGNLAWEVETEQLRQIFESYGCTSAEVIFGRNGRSRGYGLVTFDSEEAANNAVASLNDSDVAGRKMFVRHDRGAQNPVSTSNNSAPASSSTLFVGNLPWSTTSVDLHDIFAAYNPVSAKVAGEDTGRSRGYGLVNFASEAEAHHALGELMNTTEIDGRPLNIRFDRGRNNNSRQPRQQQMNDFQSTGTSVYVGNLSWNTDEELLMSVFSAHGPLRSNIARDKSSGRSRGWGTVQFADADSAQRAIQEMNGASIDDRNVNVRVDNRA